MEKRIIRLDIPNRNYNSFDEYFIEESEEGYFENLSDGINFEFDSMDNEWKSFYDMVSDSNFLQKLWNWGGKPDRENSLQERWAWAFCSICKGTEPDATFEFKDDMQEFIA